MKKIRHSALLIGAVASAGVLAGCAGGGGDTGTIVVGSQAYYSNEIVAEIYAQALEAEGFEVERSFQIGQRDAYIPALEAGEVDLFPEYTGNLLQFYNAEASATQADEVYSQLQEALPDNLVALAMSPATDQDSYNVTAEFAEANGLSSIADLAGVTPLVLGGSSGARRAPLRSARSSRHLWRHRRVQPDR